MADRIPYTPALPPIVFKSISVCSTFHWTSFNSVLATHPLFKSPHYNFIFRNVILMQALSPRELFESGARGAWSHELYRIPPHGSRPFRILEPRDYIHDEGDGCIDPRVLLSGDVSGESGNSSEEDDDVSYSGLGISQNHCHSRACDDSDIPTPPHRPAAVTVREWVNHNTPLLQEYAERQISPPLVDRVNTELNHPTQFVKGALQMLSNRNKESDEPVHPTHRLEPQLLDGFVDIHNFANEYLRSQFDQELIGDLVPVLLTIITNNFYEAYMRLMDDIVIQALANMDARKGPCLELKDFVFGFDLHMSQDMPFFVDVNHRVRDTLESLRPAKPPPATQSREPQTTRYGRVTKPTQAADEPKTKKSRKFKAAIVKKKVEQTDMTELASEPITRHATPTPEPMSMSTLGRPRKKPPPARLRATPKPRNPEVSTSWNVDRRSMQKATGRGKVPRYPQDSGHQASDPLPSIPMAESSQMFTFSVARSQAPDDGDVSQLRAAPNGATAVKSAAPPLASNTVDDTGMAVINVGETFHGPSQPQTSSPSVAHHHNPQLATKLVSWATDARSFQFVTWPTMATSTTGPEVSQDISWQRPTSLSEDSKAVDDTFPQTKSQTSVKRLSKSKVVEDLAWNNGEEEPGVAIGTSSAANALIIYQKTPDESMASDAGDQDSLLLPPVTALPTNVRVSEEEEEEAEEAEVEEEKPPLNTPSSVSTVVSPSEVNSTIAPTPTAFEEGQTPDTVTLAGYDSDATDATISTLVTSFASTPKIELQNLKSTRRTLRQRTPKPVDDSSSSQRLTIKLPAQSRASTPSLVETSTSTPSLPSTTSTSVPLRRSLRARHLALQIPAGPSLSPGSQSRVPSESVHQELSPLSGVGAVTFMPESKARATKKRKLGVAP